jgi:hypothetical protein
MNTHAKKKYVFENNDNPCERRFKTPARYDYSRPIEEDKPVPALNYLSDMP